MISGSYELDPASAVNVGRVMGPHGIRGEIKVEPLTDFADRFQRGRRLWLPDGPHVIERSRWQEDNVLLKLAGIDDRNQAAALRGQELKLPEAGPLEAGRYYVHDIIGLRVEDNAGESLGTLADVLVTGANDVYVVRGERGELLLPAIEDVVKEVNLAGGLIRVDVLPGLAFRPIQSTRRGGG